MKNLLIFTGLISLLSCGPSAEEQAKKIAKAKTDSIQAVSVAADRRYDSIGRFKEKEEKKRGFITIGTQTWTTVNLNVANFRNGDPIPEAESWQEWSKASEDGKPVWCYCEGGASYGKFYNWYAVHDSRGLAPTGWHIPTNDEWAMLSNYLNNIKESDTNKYYWTWHDKVDGYYNCTIFNNSPYAASFPNSSGLSITEGLREPDGKFANRGIEVWFWSSTECDNNNASGFSIKKREDDTYVYLTHQCYGKSQGYFCRCVKDTIAH